MRVSGTKAASIPATLGLEKATYVCTESNAIYRPIRLRSDWWLHAYEPGCLSVASSRSIRAAVSRANVALCFVPTAHPLWRDEVPTVFDLLDNWLIHPQLGGKNPEAFGHEYRRSFQAADWVTANSERTLELASSFGREALLLTNGVDHDSLKRRARQHAEVWRRRLERLPRPWLVYAGKMQQRVDVELLVRVTQGIGGSLILAGPIFDRGWMRPILRVHNVTWLGDVLYTDLPGLLAVADVGLIPHHLGHEVGGDPLKAHEYAAVGLRFVSTPITGAERIRKKGVVAEPGDDFVEAVHELGCDSRSLDERLGSNPKVDDETWQFKAERIVRLIDGPATPDHAMPARNPRESVRS
jgi:Glycosyl transferases group 1